MSLTKLKDYSVDGITFEIQVTGDGTFRTQLDGDWAEATSLKALQEKLKKHIRMTRTLAIPVTQLENYVDRDDRMRITQLTLTGIHGGSGNVLARDEKTQHSEQLRYYRGEIVRRLTGQEIQEFVALVKAAHAATQAVAEWVEARQVDPKGLIREAAEATAHGPAAVEAAHE